jgi:hypothetical protein
MAECSLLPQLSRSKTAIAFPTIGLSMKRDFSAGSPSSAPHIDANGPAV